MAAEFFRAPQFRALALMLTLAASGAASGCGGAPYIHMENEFDRSRANFNREPQDIESLTICYSSLDTSEAKVIKMARARCAEFGKTAVFESKTVTVCPILTSAAARFRCVKQSARAAETDGINRLAPGLFDAENTLTRP